MVDSRLAWLSPSAGGTRNVGSDSSVSLLQSIYGTQVSQILLASTAEGGHINEADFSQECSAQRRSRRPKSSPVHAISSVERDRPRRIRAVLQSTSVRLQQSSYRRPATAHAVVQPTSGPRLQQSRRPATVSMRPSKLLSVGSQRPHTAHGMVNSNGY